MPDLGRLLIVIGAVLIVVGAALVVFGRLPWFGRLPGDIVVERGTFTFYFPLATSIVVSVILTLLFWLVGRR